MNKKSLQSLAKYILITTLLFTLITPTVYTYDNGFQITSYEKDELEN